MKLVSFDLFEREGGNSYLIALEGYRTVTFSL